MADQLQRVREHFEAQQFMHHIGAVLQAVTPGYVTIYLPFKPELTQQHGFFHGGVIDTLADNAGGFAAFSMMGEKEQPLSMEYKLNLMSKAEGKALVARAKVLKNGRRVKVCQADVYCINEEGEYHCAVALVSVMALSKV